MSKSNIEWTNDTLNPGIYGCTRFGVGCDNCYAIEVAAGLVSKAGGIAKKAGKPNASPYIGASNGEDWLSVKVGSTSEAVRRILAVPKARDGKPRKVFVTSMADILHEDVPTDWIVACIEAMSRKPDHIWQVLTKRGQRWPEVAAAVVAKIGAWPRNVWAGLSVAHQPDTVLIKHLLQVPAAVRFLSVEPLVGPVDIRRVLPPVTGPWGAGVPPATWAEVVWPDWVPERVRLNIMDFWRESYGRSPRHYADGAWCGSGGNDDPPGFGEIAALRTTGSDQARATGRYIHLWNNIGVVVGDDGNPTTVGIDAAPARRPTEPAPPTVAPKRWRRSAISWVIVGGESGPNARPMHPAWVRSLRDQCVAAGVPFFFKQVGEWAEVPVAQGRNGDRWMVAGGLLPWIDGDGQWYMAPLVRRVGKKAAGRLLDGVEWSGVPNV